MNTFWLKIAALVVIIVAVIILISVFSPSEKTEPLSKPTAAEPVNKPAKTFYEQVDKDREKFSSPPKLPEQPAKQSAEELAKQQPAASPQGTVKEQNQPPVAQTPQQPAQPNVAKPKPESAKLYFAPLFDEDKVEAERLLSVAVSARSIGRLPQTGYQLMVQTCRQIISKWPDSWYAYNAKKMLKDMPERFQGRYNITPEELDISKFSRQRPGTKLYTGSVEEESP